MNINKPDELIKTMQRVTEVLKRIRTRQTPELGSQLKYTVADIADWINTVPDVVFQEVTSQVVDVQRRVITVTRIEEAKAEGINNVVETLTVDLRDSSYMVIEQEESLTFIHDNDNEFKLYLGSGFYTLYQPFGDYIGLLSPLQMYQIGLIADNVQTQRKVRG